MKTSLLNKAAVRSLSVLAFLVCLCALFTLRTDAFQTLQKADEHNFRSETETVYKASRAKAVLTSGSAQWKLTETGEAVMDSQGLTVPAGIVSLYKYNPLTLSDDFEVDIAYGTDGEDGEADGATAFLYMSAETFGKSLLLTDTSVLLSVCENGDVYSGGVKLNHASGAPAEDALTAKNPKIAAGDECILKIKYIGGRLSVTLECGGALTTLVKDLPREISGIKQMQLGGDKTADKRIKNITYKAITYYGMSEYVPAEGTAAVVACGESFKEYKNAESAFDDVRTKNGEGTTLQLYANVTLTKPVVLSKNASFTLDLNGYTVNRNTGGRMTSKGYVFLLDENSSLNIADSSPERENYSSAVRGGVITGGAGDDVGGGFQLKKGACLTMNGGNIIGCVTNDHGGAIRVAGKGVKIALNGVGFYSNMTCDSTDNCHGGAIYSDYGDCTVNAVGCIFEGNFSEDNGGAVYVNDGVFNSDGCIFTQNKSTDDGGAVYIESGSKVKLTDCTFTDNTANGSGGAVYCNSSDGTRLSGEFRYNTSKGNGGAVYVCGDLVDLFDAEVIGNTANGSGSGVYVDETYDIGISGLVTVRDNYDSKDRRSNMFLDESWVAQAKVKNGGLDAGSEIWVSVPDSGHTVSDDISEFQKNYFRADDTSKTLSFEEDEKKREYNQLVTSAIGGGSLIVIFVGIALIFAAAIILPLITKRKNGEGTKDNEK